MKFNNKVGIPGSFPARIPSAEQGVKSFSSPSRFVSAAVLLYAGWFFANLVYSASFFKERQELLSSLAAWVVLLSGLGSALGLILYTRFLDRPDAQSAEPGNYGSLLLILIRPFVLALALLLLALHIKIAVIERVEVSGKSMYPTLHNGDLIWIEKLSTGLNVPDLSFPLGPISVTGKIPMYGWEWYERGEVVVFRYPGVNEDREDYFIKRIIGLPGDQYEIRNGNVYINRHEIEEGYLPSSIITNPRPSLSQPPVQHPPVELNLLSTEVKYSALYGLGMEGYVPEHTVLVLGDNREHSRDSRSIGFIPTFYIQGRAFGVR